MNAKWLALAADMLDLAADEFGNHGCNDYNYPKDWTEGERREFALAMQADNVSKPVGELTPEEIEEAEYDVDGTQDWAVMRFLASELRKA